jgi:phage gpG-like protein
MEERPYTEEINMVHTVIRSITMTDLSDHIKETNQEAIIASLDLCGAQAVAYAVGYATEKNVVDTGRLRSSITHTVSGNSAFTHDYTDDNGKHYSDNIPAAGDKKENTLFLGSNVEYFVYNELGTSRGRKARPMLRPALENHVADYKEIFHYVYDKMMGK